MHATIPSVEFVVLLSKEFVTYAFVELRYEVSQNEYSTNQLVFMYNIHMHEINTIEKNIIRL